MADDNKLIVQIVLDDGSVVKGFAKIEDQAKKTAEKASNSFSEIDTDFSVDGIVSKVKGLSPTIAAFASYATVAIAAVGAAFERAFAGERLEALNNQFNDLAKTAGIVGDELKSGIEKASNGTFDFSSNIENINGALINLGATAARLPELMAVAQKSAALTGKSVEDAFNGMINAVESGNAKALRANGIFIDQEKVFKQYAATLGITAGEMNLAQRQQALLNAAIEQGSEKFKNVDANARPMLTALDRIKVAWSDISDASAKAANSAFGNFFANTLERVAGWMGNTSAKSVVLARDIDDLQKLIERTPKFGNEGVIQNLNAQLENYKNQLAAINAAEAAKAASFDDARRAGKLAGQGESAAETLARAGAQKKSVLDEAQIAAERRRENEIAQISIDAKRAELDAQVQAHENVRNIKEREANLLIDSQANAALLEEQHQQNLQAIREKYNAANGYSKQQMNAALEAEDSKHKSKLSSNESRLYAQKVALEKNKLAMTQTNLAAIAALMDSGSRELFEIGKIAGIANATISTYEAINKTLAEGGAFAMPAAIAIGIMGFANVARIATMQFGGGEVGAPAGFSAGGGLAGGITTPSESPVLADKPVEQMKPQAKIEVVVQGNILNTRESSLHIVELLNSAFEQHGAIVTGAV